MGIIHQSLFDHKNPTNSLVSLSLLKKEFMCFMVREHLTCDK